LKCRPEIFAFLHPLSVATKRYRVSGKIRILQIGSADAARVVLFLVHAYRTVHAVVEHKHNYIQPVLYGSGKLLTMHQEAAVPGKADNLPLWHDTLGAYGSRRSVAHRAGGRSQLGIKMIEAVKAMQPGGIVAGAIGQTGVWLKMGFMIRHDFTHLAR